MKQLEEFKKMMKLSKETQERFQRELEQLKREDDKNDEEDADLFTDEELEQLEKKHGSKLNKDFYDDELKPSKSDPIIDRLINIDRSLTVIANSTRTISRYLEDKGM